MHVASVANKPEFVRKIVSLVNDEFIKKMRPNAKFSKVQIETSVDKILDYYFNLGDKINNETPLHLACKHGYSGSFLQLMSFLQLII